MIMIVQNDACGSNAWRGNEESYSGGGGGVSADGRVGDCFKSLLQPMLVLVPPPSPTLPTLLWPMMTVITKHATAARCDDDATLLW